MTSGPAPGDVPVALPSSADGYFGIFTVCTGNVCRSPAVERLLQRHLDRATPWTVALGSAGTAALIGEPVHPLTARALQDRGVAADGHAARTVISAYLAPAGLILAATRTHRIPLVGLLPTARPRTFTVLEFARLAPVAAREARDPWELVAVANRLRGDVPPAHPADDDLADPIRGTAADHEAVVRLVDDAARTIAGVLAVLHHGTHRANGERQPDAAQGLRATPSVPWR